MKPNAFSELQKLITEDRLRTSSGGPKGVLIASESDKGRVINSASFRRLQQKAQVFPLDPNAAVRTRLTHSVEVSQIGRHIAQRVIKNHVDDHGGDYETLAAFVNLVETACLLHDIGNPPFGHLGESAVRYWFKDNGFTYPDLLNFDGNPQGFRLMSYLSGEDGFGFNLTCSLLLSTIKYPFAQNATTKNKFGYFSTEYETYKTCCEKLNWDEGKKFPFMHLMDTADDIAYSLSDLEDGLEKKIITLGDLKEAFKEFGENLFPSGSIDPFIAFKTKIINDATEVAAKKFSTSLDGILNGHNKKLLDGSDVKGLLDNINKYARKHIYSHESAEQVELAGRSVISGLLTHFKILLDLNDVEFEKLTDGEAKGLDFEARLLRRIPQSYINKYKTSKSPEDLRRAQLIVDYISSMTDDFALETYQILQGIRIK